MEEKVGALNVNDPEEKKIVIASLYDTFVKYLNPEVIFNSDSWICEHKSEFLQDHSSRETAVQNLIGWILENDVCEEAVCHFTSALRNLKHESDTLHPAIGGGTDDEKVEMSHNMKNIIDILDGCLIRKLSQTDMNYVLTIMLENKIITKKVCQQAKDIENPQKCCLEVLQNINKGKPNWPLVFFNALMKKRPDLIQAQRFHPDLQNEITQVNPVSSPVNNQSSSDHIAEVHHPANISDGISELSELLHQLYEEELTDSNSSINQQSPSRKQMVYMSEEQKQSPAIQILTECNNLDATRITTDPTYDNQSKSELTASYSDEEVDDVLSSGTADCEETPSLNLREYQKELAENALKGRNTIICAPTGSGKTRVATHIILSHLQKKADKEERKVAFLARTVPLVMQQCKSLKKYLPKNFEVTSLTGDSEDSMHLHMILPDNDVIVMTPRILENHLKKNCLPHLGKFSMLVFDECHHTRKGEPYNTLMYSYLKTKKQINDAEEKGEIMDIKLPQIVGLTASISVEKAVQDDEAVKYILKVCGNLDADSISCVEKNEEELKKKVPVPKEELLKLKEIENDEAVNKIFQIMGKLEKSIEHHASEIKYDELNALLKKIPSDKKSQQYGQWAVKIRNIAKAFPRIENRETIGSVRALIIIAYYLSAYNVALELHDLVLLEHVLAYLDKCFAVFSQNEHRSSNEKYCFDLFSEFKDLVKTRLHTENPNLTILKKTLLKYLIAKGNNSCGIIFVRTRALTEALASWLNTCDDKRLRNLKATIFTGTAASVDQGGMTTAEQDEVIQRFKSGDVKLLVATSVGEEGIDIPECNLVIKYNHVGNEVTTVQTRGRSRKEGGMSILLAMDKIIRKERINQEKAKMMERAIKTIRQMKRSKIRKINKEHQLQIMKDEEILQIVKQQEQSLLQKKHFKMVCHLCRKVVIDSDDIKTIFQTHHVVVNRDILEQTRTIPYKGAKFVDELRLIGSVRCWSEPEEGKHCYNKLGSMMVYSKIPFVVLGIKSFGFDVKGSEGLEFFNQWKKVPYVIDEIGPKDFKRYLPENPVITEIDNETDSDEDSDDEDGDDDKGNKPPSKSIDPDSSSSTEQAEAAFANNLRSATEQKKVLSTLGADTQHTDSRTAPKKLQNTSDSLDNGDSGFPNSATDAKGLASNSIQNQTALKQVHGHEYLTSRETNSNKVLSTVQVSAVSSFKSNETHHDTPVMSESQVNLSKHRIEDHQFNATANQVLQIAPSFESKLSTFKPFSIEKEPSLQFSVCSEDEILSNIESKLSTFKPISIEKEPSLQFSVCSEDEILSNIESSGGAESVAEASINNEGDSEESTVPIQSDRNIESTSEASRNSSDHNEEDTTPKEVSREVHENVTMQQEQSRQNVDPPQPLSGLYLL